MNLQAIMNPHILNALGVVLLGAVLAAGVGCALAMLRVMLPGVGRAADRSLAGLGTLRLMVSGVLPLVGALLIAWAVSRTGARVAVHLALGVPLLLLAIVGALAAVPHLGSRLLRSGEEASLLVRAITGAVAVGLALGTWAVQPLQPLALVVTAVFGGWLVGTGLGTIFRPSPAAAPGVDS